MNYTYTCVLSDDSELDGVLIIYNNLKSLGSFYPLTCLVNDKVSKDSIELLEFFGINYKLFTGENINNKYLINNLDIFNVFKLEEYEKVVYLDNNLLIVKDIDDLFEEESISMPLDYPFNKDKHNSRVMVLNPDSKIYTKLIKASEKKVKEEKIYTANTIINEVFNKKINTLNNNYNSVREISEVKYLNYNYLYNNQITNYGVEYLSNDFNNTEEINIVHYIGMMKPYKVKDVWTDEVCYLYKNYLYKVHMKKYEYIHSKDLVSIIIPIYNKEKYLKRCLDSVINQTYHNYELILVDDLSTDKSNDICKEYLKYDNVHLITNKKNMGVSYTRNVGLDNAKGNYLMFVDADDYIEPNMLQRLYDTIRQYDVDFVQCNFFVNDEVHLDLKGVSSYLDKKSIYELFIDGYKINIAVWNKMYKRETYKDVRFTSDSRNYEDNEFIFDIITRSKTCVIIPDPLYHYFYMKEDCLTYKKMTDEEYNYYTNLLVRIYNYTYNHYPDFIYKAKDLLEKTPTYYISKKYKKLGCGEIKEYLNNKIKEIEGKGPTVNYIEEKEKTEIDILRKKLKEYRFAKSMEKNVMASDIFDEKALNKMVDKRPKSSEALSEMLDKKQIKEFGEDLILIINN